jgi:hypothetical protein
VSDDLHTVGVRGRPEASLWLLAPDCAHTVDRVFLNNVVCCKLLGTNRGSWTAMNEGKGVQFKTIRNVIYRFFDILREQRAREFRNSGDEIHGVAAEHAFNKYANLIASLDIDELIIERP